MNIDEALQIVSYKMGLKDEVRALEDYFLIKEVVQRAAQDKREGKAEKVDLKQYMQATQLVKQARLEKYRLENEEFLILNKERSEVVETASGLQYEVLTKCSDGGEGACADLQSVVTVHYSGKLIDGVEFDSSYSRGKASEFNLQKVIKGWSEGIQLMQVGERYRFFIPQELAYGERGSGSMVPAFATLIFEVELLEIENA